MLQSLRSWGLSTIAGLALSLPLAPLQAQPVYRCGSSYSDAPCPGAQPLELQAPVPHHEPQSATSQAFLCRLGERQFWSAQPCQTHNARTLHSQSVPRHWSWEQQSEHAEREWRRAERRTATQAPSTHRADTSQFAQRDKDRPDCARAEQRLRQLDEMGRQGGSVKYMERLRKERQEVRDGQFRAGC